MFSDLKAWTNILTKYSQIQTNYFVVLTLINDSTKLINHVIKGDPFCFPTVLEFGNNIYFHKKYFRNLRMIIGKQNIQNVIGLMMCQNSWKRSQPHKISTET